MRWLGAILVGVLGLGGGVRAQTVPQIAAPTPAETAPLSAVAIKEFQYFVGLGDYTRVAAMLARDRRLARARGEFGFSAMNLQDLYFDPRIYALLLENGADVNSANDDGITLLHIISAPEYVSLLVRDGADLEARDTLGLTPLVAQLEEPERWDVVAALLAAGANPNVRGARGQTPLSLAAESEDAVALNLLLRKYGARD